MSKLTPAQVLDLATEVRRGQKKMGDLNPKVLPLVKAAMKKPAILQQHARRREKELNPLPSRHQASRPERARFV